MTDDQRYFARRFDEEAAAAVLAADARVSEIHAKLAMYYRERMQMAELPQPFMFANHQRISA